MPRAAAIRTPYPPDADFRAPELITRVEVGVPCADGKHRFSDGVLVFEGVVNRYGRVADLKTVRIPRIVPPCPELERAHREAILNSRYRPASLRGTPIAAELNVHVNISFR